MTDYLAVCTIYRDEGPYLREWLEFHRLLGVERFYMYDNLSTDHHWGALAPYVASGIVDLVEWPRHPGQIGAYADCLRRHRDDARWIAFIDLDEFLFSPTGSALPEVLGDYERWPGVGINQATFGTSGHRTPPEGLVIENYTRRTDEPAFNGLIKTVADPRRVRAFCKPSFFKYWEGETMTERHEPLGGPPWGMTREVSFDTLRINHYETKSEREYRRKAERGWTDGAVVDPKKWRAPNIARRLRRLDQVHDATLVRCASDVRRALEGVEAGARGEPVRA